MLGLAQSNNLSETAYLLPKGEDVWSLRWFTPGCEVDLMRPRHAGGRGDVVRRWRRDRATRPISTPRLAACR
jgi:hypothetical protein